MVLRTFAPGCNTCRGGAGPSPTEQEPPPPVSAGQAPFQTHLPTHSPGALLRGGRFEWGRSSVSDFVLGPPKSLCIPDHHHRTGPDHGVHLARSHPRWSLVHGSLWGWAMGPGRAWGGDQPCSMSLSSWAPGHRPVLTCPRANPGTDPAGHRGDPRTQIHRELQPCLCPQNPFFLHCRVAGA